MEEHSLLAKITYKKIALAMTVLLIISLSPILYCTFFDYANGDDLWEGAAAYRVLANHGTVSEFFSAVYEWAKVDYNSWEGNWSSIILWCLEPSIWGEKVYCITPWIGLLALCGGTVYFLYHFLKKYLAGDFTFRVMISCVVCFFAVQYMPNIRSGVFWYTGMVNYIFPYGFCLASFVWMDRFIETGKRRYFVFTSLFYAYLGGAGYPPIVLAFEIASFIIFINILRGRSEQKRRTFCLLIPLAFLAAGFIFSAVSPGNAVRGGDSYYFSLSRVFSTVFESVREGLLGAVDTFFTVRPLFLAMPLVGIITWEKIDIDEIRIEMKVPVLVISFLFLISCSMYAPGIYAQSEVSGGVPDVIYFVLLLAYILGIIYLTCYIKKMLISKKGRIPDISFTRKLRTAIILGEILFCILARRHLIGNMTGYMCAEFIRSGQLSDFEYQMQERLSILHDPETKDVVLPEMNDIQGPFMHMPVTSDPNCYTNRATARFYGKDSVIAISRNEYYELYGYPEGEKESK